MKTFKTAIKAFCAVLLLAAIFASCDLFGEKTDPISARETMEGFMATANAGIYGSLKQYTHSDAGAYSEAGTASFWETRLDTYTPLQSLSVSGNTATLQDDSGDLTFTFTLQEDEPDQYKIFRIVRDGSTIFQ